MTASDWLPIDAAAHPVFRDGLERVVEHWSRRWFGTSRIGVAGWHLTSAGSVRPDALDWTIPRHSVAIGYRSAAGGPVFERALDIRLAGRSLTERDRQVAESFTRRVLDDLADAVEAELHLSADRARAIGKDGDPLAHQHGLVVDIAEGGGADWLSLAIPVADLVGAVKRALPTPRAARDQLMPRKSAIGAQRIGLGAVLGKASVALSELRGLAPGDVLILDRRTGEPAQLSLAEDGRPALHGRLIDTDGQMAILLQD